MKRMKVLIGKRRVMVIATLAILVLAAAALVASSASFTAQSANLGNVFTSGALSMDDDQPATAWMNMSLMVPGSYKEGTVTLTNKGTVPGNFSLVVSKSAEAKNFGDALQLHITGTDGVNWTGTVSAAALMASIPLTKVNAGATVSYTIRATFMDQGSIVDNGYQSGAATVGFTWNAVTAP